MLFDKKNILIGITSSIAAYKIYELIRLYKKNNFEVKVVISPNALNFISTVTIETLSKNKLYVNQFDKREDIEHISLIEWADIFVIAPISANTISKIASGIADNLLTSTVCAYIGTKKPLVIAPAMNTNMWNNPIIQNNLSVLKNLNVEIINPESGFLACGETGIGRLANINKIYDKSLRLLFQNKENNSKKIVVTIGGTKEKIDSVRYITNSSSGKMGTALADWAYYKGYEVSAITTIELDKNYETINVVNACEMLEELKKVEFDHLIMTAAVGDFRSSNPKDFKISKESIENDFTLNLVKNPDVVKEIAKNKKENQKITGFCLADNNLIECAKQKLINKNLDYIVANDVKTALNTNKNSVTIISKSGKIIDIDLDDKSTIARKILEVICD